MFQNVWNAIDGREPGWGIKDYDLFYFDDSDLSWEAENEVLHRADRLFADVPAIIEMRNEARVHLWYEEKFGVPAPRSAVHVTPSLHSPRPLALWGSHAPPAP